MNERCFDKKCLFMWYNGYREFFEVSSMRKKFCRKCGYEIDIDDEFCENCGTSVRKKSNKNEYNIEQIVKNVDLYGGSTDYTQIEIIIEETGKKVVVKVPNRITDGDQLKLKGLGKIKPDNTRGDVFLIFKNIKYHLNVKDFKKTE